MIGQTISHYRILEKLGGGGMGWGVTPPAGAEGTETLVDRDASPSRP